MSTAPRNITTYSIKSLEEPLKSTAPPLPSREITAGQTEGDDPTVQIEKVPQVSIMFRHPESSTTKDQSYNRDASWKSVLRPINPGQSVAATAAFSASSKGQTGQERSNICRPTQTLQETQKQYQAHLKDTLRSSKSESTPSSSSWPYSFKGFWSQASPPSTNTNMISSYSNYSNNITAPSSNDARIQSAASRFSHGQLAERYVNQKQRLKEAESRILQLENEIDHHRGTNEFLLGKVQDQDFAVRKAQESAFAVVASTGPKAQDDDVIRSKLKGATSSWKPFAKKWALRSLDELSAENFDVTRSMIQELLAAGELKHNPDGLLERHNAGKAAGILLNAELARFVVEHLLMDPFTAAFGFGTDGDEDPLRSTAMQVLNSLYRYLQRDDREAAHSWRSQTVTSIDPPEYLLRSGNMATKEEARRRKENYYKELITKFESSRARALYRECSQDERIERRTHLRELFRESGDVFSALWAQKVAIDILGPNQLLKKQFFVDSTELEAHASHKLEQGDRELDGKPIQLVVEPAIIAWGNEYGEGYDQYKVWTKAVVWMSSPRD